MVGLWVREGVFFLPSLLLFACFTCIQPVCSYVFFALLLIQSLTYQKKYKVTNVHVKDFFVFFRSFLGTRIIKVKVPFI